MCYSSALAGSLQLLQKYCCPGKMHAAGKEVNLVGKCKLKMEGLKGSIKVCICLFSPSRNSHKWCTNVGTSISYGADVWQGKEQGLEGQLPAEILFSRAAGQITTC